MIKNIVVNKSSLSTGKHLTASRQSDLLKGFKSGLKILQQNSVRTGNTEKLINFHNATSFITKL